MLKPKVVLLIFVSGKIVLTGAKVREEIYTAFNNIYTVLAGEWGAVARVIFRIGSDDALFGDNLVQSSKRSDPAWIDDGRMRCEKMMYCLERASVCRFDETRPCDFFFLFFCFLYHASLYFYIFADVDEIA